MIFPNRFSVENAVELEALLKFEQEQRDSCQTGVATVVAEIIGGLRQGSTACSLERVHQQAVQFDSPSIGKDQIVSAPRARQISDSAQTALKGSIERVRKFHQDQRKNLFSQLNRTGDVRGWYWPQNLLSGDQNVEGQIIRPLKKVGIYVPGGRAVYPSSVIMNVVPALEAGVEEVVIATPAGSSGDISAEVEWVAHELGVKTILKVGGAAAIASMAYGIEGHFEPVQLIAGPGNRFVNEAKRQVWGLVGIDMMAGPSEIAMVIDDSSHFEWAAADLLTQIEHAPDNRCRVYCVGKLCLEPFEKEVSDQLNKAPRGEIMAEALKSSAAIEVLGQDQIELAAKCIDAFAPEHLSIQVQEPLELLAHVRSAGSIAVGPYSAQSFGDYAAGPSHTVPTGGAARFASPINILTFLKVSSVSHAGPESAQLQWPIASQLAQMEGFPGHQLGADKRK